MAPLRSATGLSLTVQEQEVKWPITVKVKVCVGGNSIASDAQMGLEPILPVNGTVTTDTMLNFYHAVHRGKILKTAVKVHVVLKCSDHFITHSRVRGARDVLSLQFSPTILSNNRFGFKIQGFTQPSRKSCIRYCYIL